MNKVFSAVYVKDGNTIIDISIRSDHDKISKVHDFINSLGSEYEVKEGGGILTLLIYLDHSRSNESNSIVESFYDFIE